MLHGLAKELLGMENVLSAETRALLSGLDPIVRPYESRETVYRTGDDVDYIYIAKSGWFATSIELSNGGRQLLNYYVPVDLIGLEGLTVRETATSLTALCPSEAAMVRKDRLLAALEDAPRVMNSILSLLGLQDILMQERSCAMSRLNAYDKIAYFLLLLRSKVNDKNEQNSAIIRFPLTQTDIADSLGLTNVTVSRTIGDLERAGHIQYRRNIVEFVDADALAREVGFTDRYARFTQALVKAPIPAANMRMSA